MARSPVWLRRTLRTAAEALDSGNAGVALGILAAIPVERVGSLPRAAKDEIAVLLDAARFGRDMCRRSTTVVQMGSAKNRAKRAPKADQERPRG